jgi:hypothetical protein
MTALAGGLGFITGHRSGEIAVWKFAPADNGSRLKLARP